MYISCTYFRLTLRGVSSIYTPNPAALKAVCTFTLKASFCFSSPTPLYLFPGLFQDIAVKLWLLG